MASPEDARPATVKKQPGIAASGSGKRQAASGNLKAPGLKLAA
ncbi:Unknown protein sequence [Pseudomonas syringae pv. cilantro]|uniref:Uncharacterized protein n=1 Tax=Pseudomonas syringae pv. cilantro TaxID=81035 RepID=A0A0N0GD28_PSESX|nr:Unknown protein sequence [Pseudomonas syringae pv. cilantro]